MFLDRKEQKELKGSKHHKKQMHLTKESSQPKHPIQSLNQQYLSPVNIKSPKNKSRFMKQSKVQKQALGQEGGKGKGRNVKTNKSQLNGTIIINQNIEFKNFSKENKNNIKIKTKYEDKNFGQTEKKFKKMKKQDKDIFSKKTMNDFQGLKIKQRCSKIEIVLPQQQEEYLFLGDSFYLINNYCPTKRLLNTYREALTSNDNTNRKFIAQDTSSTLGKKKVQMKRNIFTATRQYIECRNKTSKAIIIQRWWRKVKEKLANLNQQRFNPQFEEYSPQSISWENNISDINQMSSSSKETHNNSPPIIFPTNSKNNSNKLQNILLRMKENIQSDIITFDSVQIIDAPKKIQLKKQTFCQNMMEEYKIPEISEMDQVENEEIFGNFNNFVINSANEYNNSPDSQELSQNFMNSPIQSQQQIFNEQEIQQLPVQTNALNLIQEFQQATKIKQQIQFRLLLQKGQIRLPETSHNRIGINTSIISVHNFLVRFFHHYIQHNKEEFLSCINMPFGYSINSRLKHLRGESLPSEPQEDEDGIVYGLKHIIDDKKYEYFWRTAIESQLNMNNSFLKANGELQAIHHKAIIDVFNQELNKYRPYCQINGVPYPWNHSYKALTFYFVTEDNILEVFQKVELKILQNASLLCGINLHSTHPPASKKENLDFEVASFMNDYQDRTHGLVFEHNEAKQIKLIQQQLKQQTFEPNCQTHTSILLQLSDAVFEQFLFENITHLYKLFNRN